MKEPIAIQRRGRVPGGRPLDSEGRTDGID